MRIAVLTLIGLVLLFLAWAFGNLYGFALFHLIQALKIQMARGEPTLNGLFVVISNLEDWFYIIVFIVILVILHVIGKFLK